MFKFTSARDRMEAATRLAAYMGLEPPMYTTEHTTGGAQYVHNLEWNSWARSQEEGQTKEDPPIPI